ncbi:Hypothetical predicted protein, partial [Pelobates cultripes]
PAGEELFYAEIKTDRRKGGLPAITADNSIIYSAVKRRGSNQATPESCALYINGSIGERSLAAMAS